MVFIRHEILRLNPEQLLVLQCQLERKEKNKGCGMKGKSEKGEATRDGELYIFKLFLWWDKIKNFIFNCDLNSRSQR